MSGFLRSALSVTRRNALVWRSFMAASVVGHFVEPVLYLVALGYGLGSIIPSWGGTSYAAFIAPGLVLATAMRTATFECTLGTFGRMQNRRIFDAILATPVTVSELVLGEVIWGALKATLGAAVVLTVVTALGLASPSIILGILPLAFVGGCVFSSMALCVTAVSRSFEPFNYYFVLVMAPMFLLSGVFFPLDRAPVWAANLAQLMPLTHFVEIARWLTQREMPFPSPTRIIVITILVVVSYGFALVLMRRRLVN